jgi:hypothetical protein
MMIRRDLEGRGSGDNPAFGRAKDKIVPCLVFALARIADVSPRAVTWTSREEKNCNQYHRPLGSILPVE